MAQSQSKDSSPPPHTSKTKPVTDSLLIERVTEYVKQYMSHYDGSHDYNHILRVLGLTRLIASSSSPSQTPRSSDPPPPQYDPLTITLSALLHDVGDKKYLKAGESAETMVENVLLGFGADKELAKKIQKIASAVSYSSETKSTESRQRVARLVKEIPELGVVQDADRLDAIGSVGIGRTFTFGGAVGERALLQSGGQNGVEKGTKRRGMDETIEHFTDKLEKLEGLMKTDVGRKLARERTRRLKLFREWWAEEARMAEDGLKML
jgi:uncharacterized protein